MLDDSFHANRWDYIYRFKPGYGEIDFKQATLYFNDNKLINIQGTFRPGDKSLETRNTTEIVIVPLEDFDGENTTGEKSYWQRFTDFFAWTEEHEGIATDNDIPVNSRGEGEVISGVINQSPQSNGE
jgi:outer membrane protein assembly factor BamE